MHIVMLCKKCSLKSVILCSGNDRPETQVKANIFEWGRTFSVPLGSVHSSSANPRLHSSASLAATPSQSLLFGRKKEVWLLSLPLTFSLPLFSFIFICTNVFEMEQGLSLKSYQPTLSCSEQSLVRILTGVLWGKHMNRIGIRTFLNA